MAIAIPVGVVLLVVICVCIIKSSTCSPASSHGATPCSYQSAGQGTVAFQTGKKQYSYGELKYIIKLRNGLFTLNNLYGLGEKWYKVVCEVRVIVF